MDTAVEPVERDAATPDLGGAAVRDVATTAGKGRFGLARRIGAAVLVVVVAAVVVGLLGVAVAVRTGHLALSPVLSGSMQPSVSTGDLALLWQVPASDLTVGDVVSYYAPNNSTTPTMHRIVALSRTDGKTTVTTRGDANNINDPWGPATLRGDTAYRMVGDVPYVGWTASLISRLWIGLALIASGLVLAVLFLRDFRHAPVQPSTQPLGGIS
ncbi:MAG: signal peptidase I [Candidatus Dormibacteraeota bacterium]|nr:signal peptidase I [Candidatus Dormibacteraeota bacterium]